MITLSIGDGHYLQENAARSVMRMRRDGAPVGPINSSTRSYAQQADWYAHQGQPNYPSLADNPNKSKHVWRPDSATDKGARALDVSDPLKSWMARWGAAYGWIRTIASESWHFEYHESRDQFINTPVYPTPAPTPVPAPTNKDWFDMATKKELEELLDRRTPVQVVYFFIENDPMRGAVYEAVLEDKLYRHVPDEETLMDRQGFLGALGVKWIKWMAPVKKPGKFGELAPWFEAW